jgi:hypothetical protein
MKRTQTIAAFALVAMALVGCQLTPPVAEYTIEQFLDTTAIFGGSFSPDEKTILFSSNESGIYNAYTMPVEYIVFEDEGHGFRKKENQIRGYKAILVFLDRHLKGVEGP